MENLILIDWLCFTVRDKPVDDVFDLLKIGKNQFIEMSHGHYGYHKAYYFCGIWVMYDGQENMGVCVEMSGQGCRQFETSSIYNLDDFIVDLYYNHSGINFTRLDVAFDDIDKSGNGLLNLKRIESLAKKDLYISKFGVRSGEWSGVHSDEGKKTPLARSVYFGSAKSDTRFRIYDKALERGGLDYHWVRFEMQLRSDRAVNFISLLASEQLGVLFSGCINNYLRFVVSNSSDTNRRRWASPKWWTDFLGNVGKVSLFSRKGIDYNFTRLQRYAIGQAGSSVLTYIKCVGLEQFIQDLKEKEDKLNDSQKALIAEYEAIKLGKLKDYWAAHPWG